MSKLTKVGFVVIFLVSFQCSDTPIVFNNKTKYNYIIKMHYKIRVHDEIINIEKNYSLKSFSKTPIIPHNSTWKNYMKYSKNGKIKFDLLKKDLPETILYSYLLNEEEMRKRKWEIRIDNTLSIP